MKIYNTLFFGTPDFAVPSLKAILDIPAINLKAVVTQPDKPVGKKQVITASPIKQFALKNKLIVHQPTKIKNSDFIEIVKEYKPDVIIIIAYGKIIPQALLNIPKFGWLNIHGSLLPKYRGASPIQAAILGGEEKTGVTLMKIDAGLDTGPIISQLETPINNIDNFEVVHDKLSKLSARLLTKDLLKYLDGTIKPQAQGETTTEITTTINKEDGKINWEKNADFIDRQIRAYSPWPGTYTYWGDRRLKIIEAEFNMLPNSIKPGSVFYHGKKYFVGAKINAINIKKIQLAGKKPMDIKTFIKGYPDFINAVLT